MAIADLLEEEDINLASLGIELEKASYAYETQGECYYVLEDGTFPFWVRVKSDPKFIILWSYMDVNDDVTEQQMLEFSNRTNRSLILPTTFIARKDEYAEGESGHRLQADWAIIYRDGLITSQFIRMCRIFSDSMFKIQDEIDEHHKYLRPVRTSRIP